MIVPSMNKTELAKEIYKDSVIVWRKAKYLTDGVRREAIKTRNKNLVRIFKYKSKQKNEWLIISDYSQGDPKIYLSIIYYNDLGFNAVSVSDEYLVHYTSHFLQRYNERYLRQEGLEMLELYKKFIIVNATATYDFTLDDSKKVVARFRDGLGFGLTERQDFFFIFMKTYISPEMIFEDQKNGYDTITRGFNEFMEDLQKNRQTPTSAGFHSIANPYTMEKRSNNK
jgi:hypothetical protein